MIKLQYLPTKNTFLLPEQEVERIIFSDPDNYIVIRSSKPEKNSKTSTKKIKKNNSKTSKSAVSSCKNNMFLSDNSSIFNLVIDSDKTN